MAATYRICEACGAKVPPEAGPCEAALDPETVQRVVVSWRADDGSEIRSSIPSVCLERAPS